MSNDSNHREGQSLVDKIKEGEPLMTRAVDALRRYHKAQGAQSANEVERLRLEAEALFAAVNEHQHQVFGGAPSPLH
jgi:hypothetical protein